MADLSARQEIEQAIATRMHVESYCEWATDGRPCPHSPPYGHGEEWAAGIAVKALLDGPGALVVPIADRKPHDAAAIAAWGVEQGREQADARWRANLAPLLALVDSLLLATEHTTRWVDDDPRPGIRTNRHDDGKCQRCLVAAAVAGLRGEATD